MRQDHADVERVRLEAALDRLRAENADLRRKVQAREVLAGLRAAGREGGCCPVCRGPVPPGPTPPPS